MADLKLQISLKMENEQIKTVQKNSFGWHWRETAYSFVEVKKEQLDKYTRKT